MLCPLCARVYTLAVSPTPLARQALADKYIIPKGYQTVPFGVHIHILMFVSLQCSRLGILPLLFSSLKQVANNLTKLYRQKGYYATAPFDV